MIKITLGLLSVFSLGFATAMHPMEIERLGENDNYPNKLSERIEPTGVPQGPVRNIAEFEPQEGVIISYPNEFGISLDVIKEISEVAKVYCLTNNSGTVQSYFNDKGITNYEIINHSPDAYWTRDCAPWWIFDGNNKAAIIDFNYNRPRPNDNQIPAKMANELGVDRYDMGINDCGGNYMCDGIAIGAATNLVHEENQGVDVNNIKKNFLGIQNFITVDDPNLDQSYQIDHIDCWGKFLAPDKIMIRKVPQSNESYQLLEEVADMYANTTSSYETKFRVYRVYASNGEPYTNCLIVNNKVLVPVKGTSNDEPALQAYRDAMPGYEVIGMSDNGYPDWLATDALHCRTKGIPDRGMLYVGHIPLHDTIKVTDNNYDIDVKCKIYAYSGKTLKSDSLLLYYKYSYDSFYKAVKLTSFDTDSFFVALPKPIASSAVEYYIAAADNSGRQENHPYMGSNDPHTFYVDMGNVNISGEEFIVKNTKLEVMNIPNGLQISYSLPSGITKGLITLFNSRGIKVSQKEIITNKGSAELVLLNNSSGYYFCRLQAGDITKNIPVLYTK